MTSSDADPIKADNDGSMPAVDQDRLLRLIGYRLTHTELQVRRLFQDCVKPFDLKPVEFSILVLTDANAGINQRQIGEVLNVSPPNLVIVVAKLVKRKLLRQVRGRQDRRMQHLHLTPSGKEMLVQAEREVVEMETRVSSMLTDAEQRTFYRLLDKLDKV
ncbi:MarR family winged helix-turn-helix transcriptional regulator [Lysobacter sp. CA199]|uniref:MarR family winged helix-turn-helix transcriptional regulator n=1 Tax=Lysobacter sp. CA199 TaxID=3455608 RepID=UPI003F8D19A4